MLKRRTKCRALLEVGSFKLSPMASVTMLHILMLVKGNGAHAAMYHITAASLHTSEARI
jgi:hypothetical protein